MGRYQWRSRRSSKRTRFWQDWRPHLKTDTWRLMAQDALTLTFSWSSQRLRRVLAASAVYQSLVLIMRTDPEPVEDIAFAHGERSIRFVDADAPQPADWLQVQGRMCGVHTKELKLLVRGALRVAECVCRGPRTPPKHENEKSSFAARRGNHRPEFSGADIGLNLLNHMEAAAARRKIPCHLPVPFIHGLETKPRGKRYLVFVGEPGDRVFDRVDSHAPTIMAHGAEAIHLAGTRPSRRRAPPGPQVYLGSMPFRTAPQAPVRQSPSASSPQYQRNRGQPLITRTARAKAPPVTRRPRRPFRASVRLGRRSSQVDCRDAPTDAIGVSREESALAHKDVPKDPRSTVCGSLFATLPGGQQNGTDVVPFFQPYAVFGPSQW